MYLCIIRFCFSKNPILVCIKYLTGWSSDMIMIIYNRCNIIRLTDHDQLQKVCLKPNTLTTKTTSPKQIRTAPYFSMKFLSLCSSGSIWVVVIPSGITTTWMDNIKTEFSQGSIEPSKSILAR